MRDDHVVAETTAIQGGADRFLGLLLEIISADATDNNHFAIGFLDRQASERGKRALLEGLTGLRHSHGRDVHQISSFNRFHHGLHSYWREYRVRERYRNCENQAYPLGAARLSMPFVDEAS